MVEHAPPAYRAFPTGHCRDDDIVRVMVATDNHLGFMERDPVRGNDSFAAFEEILAAGE
jgi:double-strand break repair protein MRE11